MANRIPNPGIFLNGSSLVPIDADFCNNIVATLNSDSFDANTMSGKSLSEITLDDLSDGITYKRVTSDAIGTDNKIDFSKSGFLNKTLDNLSDGTTYKKAADSTTYASEALMLVSGAKKGDIAVRSDLGKTYILSTTDPTQLVNWVEIKSTGVAGKIWVLNQPYLAGDLVYHAADGLIYLCLANTSTVEPDYTNAGVEGVTWRKLVWTMASDGKGYMPIGATYVQYPGTDLPGDIFTGTWSNVSASYAGAFFRAEGGAALAFGAGQQDAQNLTHTHTNSVGNQSADHYHSGTTGNQSVGHTHAFSGSVSVSLNDRYSLANSGNSFGVIGSGPSYIGWTTQVQSGSFPFSGTTGGISANHTHTFTTGVASASHNHEVTINSSGGADLRPINYTVRIWKRTA